jgi:hypothetical protein
MNTHKIEVLGEDVECHDENSPEAKACDELIEKLSDVIDGASIKVIMPALANMMGLVALDSGTPLSRVVSFAAVTIAAIYENNKRPEGEPLQ